MSSPCVAALRSFGIPRDSPVLTEELIGELARDTVCDWLVFIGSAISDQAHHVELYAAMGCLMIREVKIRGEEMADEGDEDGDLFYRIVAQVLQREIEEQMGHERDGV